MEYRYIIGQFGLTSKSAYLYANDLITNIDWTLMPENATWFNSEEECLLFIKERLNTFENHAIRKISIKDGKFVKILTLKKIKREVVFKTTDVTIDTIKGILDPEELFSIYEYDDEYIVSHRKELKSKIIKQIGQLIDFHNSLDYVYATTKLNTQTVKKHIEDGTNDWCLGCTVCDEIHRLSEELEIPIMTRNYDAIYDIDFPRFEPTDGTGVLKIPEKHLAALMHDYVELKKKGLNDSQIAIAYSTHVPTFRKILYKMQTDPEFYRVTGLSKPKRRRKRKK